MKTKTYHINHFGAFGVGVVTDTEGYVIYHDSRRYSKATEVQLLRWVDTSLSLAVRNAAQTELNERCLEEWRRRRP